MNKKSGKKCDCADNSCSGNCSNVDNPEASEQTVEIVGERDNDKNRKFTKNTCQCSCNTCRMTTEGDKKNAKACSTSKGVDNRGDMETAVSGKCRCSSGGCCEKCAESKVKEVQSTIVEEPKILEPTVEEPTVEEPPVAQEPETNAATEEPVETNQATEEVERGKDCGCANQSCCGKCKDKY